MVVGRSTHAIVGPVATVLQETHPSMTRTGQATGIYQWEGLETFGYADVALMEGWNIFEYR